jgi:hypothetical protein
LRSCGTCACRAAALTRRMRANAREIDVFMMFFSGWG